MLLALPYKYPLARQRLHELVARNFPTCVAPMQASRPSLLALCLGLILLCATSGSRAQRRCRIDTLRALEPAQRFEAGAGVIELYDEGEGPLECAGVSVARVRVEPGSLLSPHYSNSPRMFYILQGRGISGTVVSGCPDTFEEEAGSPREGVRRDEHQRITHIKQGDVLAIPAGVPFWAFSAETIIALSVYNVANDANQLDPTYRDFLLAGLWKGEGRGGSSENNYNILSGFDTGMLAEAIGVSNETVRRMQGLAGKRGLIVLAGRGGLRMRRLARERRWEEDEDAAGNGLGEALCSAGMRQNIADPMEADIYSPSGNITVLNSQKMPILKRIQMSASRGILRPNAILAPHWNNAHAVVYATSGSARLQVVSNEGRRVFDGELRSGQLLVVPQSFVVLAQSRAEEDFSWVSFQTSENAMSTPVVGKTSALRGIPAIVLSIAYVIPDDEVRRIKFFRDGEMAIFSPVNTSSSKPEMLFAATA